MILLQTLSRLHVCATLAIAQMLGSVVVIIARATAPNRVRARGEHLPRKALTIDLIRTDPLVFSPMQPSGISEEEMAQ